MKLLELRRVLQQVVLVGLPVGGVSGCGLIYECSEYVETSYAVTTPADPPMQLRVDSCRVDIDACIEVCVLAMERSGNRRTIARENCDVRFTPEVVDVTVGYTQATGAPGCPVDGRRPAGLVEPGRIAACDAAGAWLAHAAWLEAASVHAFVHLARELAHHGAPGGLVRWAMAAAGDEVRHTALMTHLARRYGGEPPALDVTLPDLRTLEALAIENAIEGCVRETWGAVLALWQSQTARDPALRAGFAIIARDEQRHAALAWAVDRWAMPRLDDAARARVQVARDAAARELLDHPDPGVLLSVLGMPDAGAMRGLLARTDASLWRAS